MENTEFLCGLCDFLCDLCGNLPSQSLTFYLFKFLFLKPNMNDKKVWDPSGTTNIISHFYSKCKLQPQKRTILNKDAKKHKLKQMTGDEMAFSDLFGYWFLFSALWLCYGTSGVETAASWGMGG